MPLIEQRFLGILQGLKITNEKFLRPTFFSSASSLTSTKNALSFILDVYKIMYGDRQLRQELINFLKDELLPFTKEIFKDFKNEIVKFYYCSLDDLIPDKYFVDFVRFKIKEIDFFGILKVDPNSNYGKYYYSDIADDLNKLLYEVINNEDVEYNWKNILILKRQGDFIYVKLDEDLKGKTFNEFVSAFFSNLEFPNEINILGDLVDGVYGLLSSLGPFSNKNILNRIKFDVSVERMYDSIDTNDSFFEFNDEEISIFTNSKLKGFYEFENCVLNKVSYAIEDLDSFANDLVTLPELKQQIYTTNFNYLINKTVGDTDTGDGEVYANNLFLTFFKNITKSLSFFLFSPKQILFIKLFVKLTRDIDIQFDFEQFLKKHLNLLFNLIKKRIFAYIITFLLEKVLSEIKELVDKNNANKSAEKLKFYLLQIRSLTGIIL
jgi:hypothetical protein